MGSSFPVLEAGECSRKNGGGPEKRRSFTERFRGWQPRRLSDQRRSSANAMPEASPLRPMSHWRSGKPAIGRTLVLIAEPLRQLHWLAAVGEGKGDLTRGQRADPADPRPRW